MGDIELYSDVYFMKKALDEAYKALEMDEVPVGAIVVTNNKIISKSHNLTERLCDVTAHAELMGITAASNYLNGKFLTQCVMYVTLEPCIMCAGALYLSRLDRLVIGARDKQRGFKSLGVTLHPKTKIEHGVLEDECSLLLREFFNMKR